MRVSPTHLSLSFSGKAWCDFAHDRDCSFAGIYQPPLPLGSHDFKEFIVSSNFVDVFSFLQLPGTSNLASVRQGARTICTMSLYELEVYNSKLSSGVSDVNDLVQYCFRATFVASFLIDGIGFPEAANVTAIDVIDGQKLGWALGSTLYEINTLPWEFEGSLLKNVDTGPNDGDKDGEKRTISLVGGHDDVFVASLVQSQATPFIHAMFLVALLTMTAFRRRFSSNNRQKNVVVEGKSETDAGTQPRRDDVRTHVTYGSL